MRTQSSTAFLARVISGAQGISRRNRGWRCTRVTWSRILLVLYLQPGMGHRDSRVPRCEGRRYLAPSGRACSPGPRGASSGSFQGCCGWFCLWRSLATRGWENGSPHLSHCKGERDTLSGRHPPCKKGDILIKVGNLLGGNPYTLPMKPPITLVALDHQPAVVRATAESNTHQYRRRIQGTE